MKWNEWLEKWSMKSLKIKTSFLEMEWAPNDVDKYAAWELYIELLTRITTQELPIETGDEAAALESVYKIFQITREIIKKHGYNCNEFSKIAIVVLNQIIRPFTSKWHKQKILKAFENQIQCGLFRKELFELQSKLRIYTKMLADMIDVEDLTDLEE